MHIIRYCFPIHVGSIYRPTHPSDCNCFYLLWVSVGELTLRIPKICRDPAGQFQNTKNCLPLPHTTNPTAARLIAIAVATAIEIHDPRLGGIIFVWGTTPIPIRSLYAKTTIYGRVIFGSISQIIQFFIGGKSPITHPIQG